LDVIAIGKINDIFTGEGVTQAIHTKSNQDGIDKTIEVLSSKYTGLAFTNLVDFDSLYGHRRDPVGYGRCLQEFDDRLPEILEGISGKDLLILTADHGNDPVHSGTDHTREYVPILLFSPSLRSGASIGVGATFADLGATIADNFNVASTGNGVSFLKQLQ
jgi:phosphopentomutase